MLFALGEFGRNSLQVNFLNKGLRLHEGSDCHVGGGSQDTCPFRRLLQPSSSHQVDASLLKSKPVEPLLHNYC